MRQLGNGLSAAKHHEDELIVEEAQLSMRRRLGASEYNILGALNNLANTYARCGRPSEALRLRQNIYSRRLKLNGEDHKETIDAANNYAAGLVGLQRDAEAKVLLRKTIPVAQRVLGDSNEATIKLQCTYADALGMADGVTLDNLREAVTTLEETERTARRVLGGAHPLTGSIEFRLPEARAALAARETPRA
jgi:hypothetical protein